MWVLAWAGRREKLGGEGASMYVYCGHGSGELFWSRQEVGQLAKGPLAVLMGCSSGRLKEQGDFEPTGTSPLDVYMGNRLDGRGDLSKIAC